MVMQPVPLDLYQRADSLFSPLNFHLAVGAVLAGATPGRLWLDDVEHPRAGLIQVHHRFYISGTPINAEFNRGLHDLFIEDILPHGREAGEDAFSLYFSDGWEPVIEEEILRDVEPISGERQYYENSSRNGITPIDLPDDYQMVEVGRALLDDSSLDNLDDLIEEMQSERSSVEEFLHASFGLCLRSQNRILTWCLSEYNLENRCEVGIATDPACRRRGLAAFTGAAFLRLAENRGYPRVGWHCWTSNEGSWRTALKIGFRKVCDYTSYLVFFQPSVHLAVAGNIKLNQGRFAEALNYLDRSVAEGDAPGWAYLSAACASARLDETSKAFGYLKTAAAHGIRDPQRIAAIDHLKTLHGLAAWAEFIQGLRSE